MNSRRTRVAVTGLTAGGIAAFGLLVPATAASAAETIERPTVSSQATSTPGSIAPNFSLRSDGTATPTKKTGPSIKLTSLPKTATPGEAVTATAEVSGYSVGNWVNAWIRLPDGTIVDAGGAPSTSATEVSLPVRMLSPGVNQVQLSLGSYTNEGWTQASSVTVSEPAPQTSAAVAYRKLNGITVIKATANVQAVPGPDHYQQSRLEYGATTKFTFANDEGEPTVLTPAATSRTVYATTFSPGGTNQSLSDTAPGSAVAMTVDQDQMQWFKDLQPNDPGTRPGYRVENNSAFPQFLFNVSPGQASGANSVNHFNLYRNGALYDTISKRPDGALTSESGRRVEWMGTTNGLVYLEYVDSAPSSLEANDYNLRIVADDMTEYDTGLISSFSKV